jgi:hypothetical protein
MKFKYLIIFLAILTAGSFAQINETTQRYRNDAKGNASNKRESVMDGNLVRTLFWNTGEVAYYKFQPSGEWPKGSGHSYIDGVCVLIGSEIQTKSGIVHSIESNYREEMDKDPTTGELWGLAPVPNYSNPSSTKPAINKDAKSWPSSWPAALGLTPDWDGFWYGYFGKGIMNSDFETFFVLDDNRDGEFRRAPYNFYPMQNDTSWGGIGIRVEVRGFQWSHVLAEDIIFWHYDIVNISDNDLDSTCFGFYSDPGVGGTDDNGDNVYYDSRLDLTYAWDSDGLGIPDNWKTGYYGYAYLESPGNALNGIDDDEDNIVDESRDDGIDNDHDWVGFNDINGNGVWDKDTNEPLNNDVGADGIGPFDDGYTGPDAGEGDGVPTEGEPNFDKTDKDESDQLGLMAVSITILSDKSTTGIWPKNDEVMWNTMTGGFKDTAVTNNNISMVFSSGPFPLKLNKRERFSMALLFGSDLEDLVFNKNTVQEIYNANYNFLKPPKTPTLTAVAGDKKVYLYWDSKAEESTDAFMGYQIKDDPNSGPKKDFEGYLLYRSNEPEFNDVKVITDSKGETKYWKPIAQYDIVDSMEVGNTGVFAPIAGPDPVGINGAHFWRGSQTGLKHSYIDEDVVNGQRYYYALVSYDMGDPYRGTSGLQPSECTKIITEDFSGVITFIDRNCAVVTPNAPAAGYIPPQVTGNLADADGVGTGKLKVTVLNPGAILNGASYKVQFNSTVPSPILYKTTDYNVVRTYNGTVDTIVSKSESFGADASVSPFDGLTFSVMNDSVAIVDSTTGWLSGKSNYMLWPSSSGISSAMPTPKDYELHFYSTDMDTTVIIPKIPVPLTVTNITDGYQTDLAVVDMDGSKTLTVGDSIYVVEYVSPNHTQGNMRIAWKFSYELPLNPTVTPVPPTDGDVYRLTTSKPFKSGDVITFVTKQATTDDSKAKTDLSNVKVVPNPYLGAAYWEKRNLNSTGRGERRIDFIHLPAACTIRIYSIAGQLVKTLHKDSGPADGALSWDLISDDGMDIAYGVYIYHIDAPGIGEHIGKLAVIK